MSSIGILIIGAIVVASLAWQILVFSKFDKAARAILLPPALIGAVVVAGVFVYSIFLWIDPTKTGTGIFDVGARLFWAILFLAMIVIKNVFGPSVLGINAAYTIYNYLEHDVIQIWPVMAWTIKLVIHTASEPAVMIYTIIFLLISLVCNGLAFDT